MLHRSLAAPDTDHAKAVDLEAIDDAEERVDQLAEPGLVESRHDPAALRELADLAEAIDDLADQPLPYLRRRLLGVPGPDALEIANGRLRNRDAGGHSAESEPATRVLQ